MKPDATNFHYIKLRNLFLAHQETHSQLKSDALDDIKKSRLKKKLLSYEDQIRKLLNEKRSMKCLKERQSDESSTYFIFNRSKSSSHEQIRPVLLKNGTIKYFNRKRPTEQIDRTRSLDLFLLARVGLVEVPYTMESFKNELELIQHINGLDGHKFMNCLDEKLTLAAASRVIEQKDNTDLDIQPVPSSTIPSPLECRTENENANVNIINEQDNKQNDQCEAAVPNASTPMEIDIDYEKLEFFRKLDLYTQEEYNEMISRKHSRKRRTTANPQFSSAALEAKRVTQQEIINERKHRRQQVASDKQKQFKRAKGIDDQANDKITQFAEEKGKNFFKTENKQLNSGLYLVKKITNAKYHCKVCMEMCQCTIDTVIVCKKCSTFFHLTCVLPKKDLSKLFDITCPNCAPNSQLKHDKTNPTVERDKLLNRLNELRKYIISLTYANQILQFLCEQRGSEKLKLQEEIDNSNMKIAYFKKCLSTFAISDGKSERPISDKLNARKESSDSCTNNGLNHQLETYTKLDTSDPSLFKRPNDIYSATDSAPKCDNALALCI